MFILLTQICLCSDFQFLYYNILNQIKAFTVFSYHLKLNYWMQSTEHFTVDINGKKILCNKQIAKMSTFINNLLFLGSNTFDFGLQEMSQNAQEQQIHIQLVDEQTFMSFLSFCQLNDYKQPVVLKPNKLKNDLRQYLDEKNFNFIQKFEIQSPEIIELGKAALFLGCQSLLKVVCAKYAALIYFDDNKKAYEQKCVELGISPEISAQDLIKYLAIYRCMDS